MSTQLIFTEKLHYTTLWKTIISTFTKRISNLLKSAWNKLFCELSNFLHFFWLQSEVRWNNFHAYTTTCRGADTTARHANESIFHFIITVHFEDKITWGAVARVQKSLKKNLSSHENPVITVRNEMRGEAVVTWAVIFYTLSKSYSKWEKTAWASRRS